MSAVMKWNGPALQRELRALNGKGVRAAAIYLAGKVKEKISIAAPRTRVKSRKGGIIYYRATTPATPGAPPRKLSGQLRRTIAWEYEAATPSARVGTNRVGARALETWMKHAYLEPTLKEEKSTLEQIYHGAAK